MNLPPGLRFPSALAATSPKTPRDPFCGSGISPDDPNSLPVRTRPFPDFPSFMPFGASPGLSDSPYFIAASPLVDINANPSNQLKNSKTSLRSANVVGPSLLVASLVANGLTATLSPIASSPLPVPSLPPPSFPTVLKVEPSTLVEAAASIDAAAAAARPLNGGSRALERKPRKKVPPVYYDSGDDDDDSDYDEASPSPPPATARRRTIKQEPRGRRPPGQYPVVLGAMPIKSGQYCFLVNAKKNSIVQFWKRIWMMLARTLSLLDLFLS